MSATWHRSMTITDEQNKKKARLTTRRVPRLAIRRLDRLEGQGLRLLLHIVKALALSGPACSLLAACTVCGGSVQRSEKTAEKATQRKSQKNPRRFGFHIS